MDKTRWKKAGTVRAPEQPQGPDRTRQAVEQQLLAKHQRGGGASSSSGALQLTEVLVGNHHAVVGQMMLIDPNGGPNPTVVLPQRGRKGDRLGVQRYSPKLAGGLVVLEGPIGSGCPNVSPLGGGGVQGAIFAWSESEEAWLLENTIQHYIA